MYTSILAQMDSTAKDYGLEYPLTSLCFDLQGAFLQLCGRGDLLTWRMRDVVWGGPSFLP